MYLKKTILLIITALLVISGLGFYAYQNKDVILYKQAKFTDLPNWENQDFVSLKKTFIDNCSQIKRFYKNKELNAKFGSQEQWQDFCSGLQVIPDDSAKIKNYFQKLEVIELYQPFESKSLFTGYYSPMLNGSYTKTEKYNYPLYKRPPELVSVGLGNFIKNPDFKYRQIFGKVENSKLVPYLTRKQIDESKDFTDEDVIVWVDDKVDAFFLHIQGSGEVKIDKTGETIRVGYAAQNGHAYNAIGGYMAAQGMIDRETISLQTIRKYLEENPDKVDEILHKNPSYIFFAKKEDGPYGAFGNVLTDDQSVAVDRRFIPLGTPLFIDTKVTATGEDYQKMVFAQDVGGAIKGAIRADLFFGSDEKAEFKSGKQNQEGKLYVLSAKNIKL